MLEEKVLDTIKKYNLIENGDKIVVGVSGGPDSICLLNVLNELNINKSIDLSFQIIVAHVNHMIREEAASDEEFVKRFCEDKGILFVSEKIDIINLAKAKKIGTEEAGREERYKFFQDILREYKCNKIATAHTKCDNAETLLMNIIRGTGTARTKRDPSKKR